MLIITHEKEEARAEYNVSYFSHNLCSYLLISKPLTCIPNGHCHYYKVKVNSRLTQSDTKQINREGKDGDCKNIGILY